MVDVKYLRLDAFLYQFYKSYWEFVILNLHKLYLKALHIGYLGNLINKGNIKFFPKKGDPELITN